MTKQQAIEEMEKGNKVTHRFFMPHEWITIINEKILYEDGIQISINKFWKYFVNECFDEDWEIYQTK